MFDDVPEDSDDQITEELCPECGKFIDMCECDDDEIICPDCGELHEECICEDEDDDELIDLEDDEEDEEDDNAG